jgi:hypothetical protein
MADHSKLYTLDHEQGQVNMEQADSVWRVLIGIRATLRRDVLARHAEHIQMMSPVGNPVSWEDAVEQTFLEIGHLVNETQEALLDDPIPPDYTPHF